MLVEKNLQLVPFIINTYYRAQLRYFGFVADIEYRDVLQEGVFGLMAAAQKYDPARGNKFSTYAVWWIKAAIALYFKQKLRTVRIPLYLERFLGEIEKTRKKLSRELQREPTDDEIALRMGIDPEKLAGIKFVPRTVVPLDENNEAPDDFANPEVIIFNLELRREVGNILRQLSSRQEFAICRHFGFDGDAKSLEDVGRLFDPPITRQAVNRIEAKAIKRLKHPRFSAQLTELRTKYG